MENLLNTLRTFSLVDLIDVLLLALLFYYLILLIKGTKSYQMAIGLLLIGLLALLADLFKFTAFSFILNNFLTYLIFAIIVLFQDDFRKILSEIGGRLKATKKSAESERIREEIINAVIAMSLARIGALITIERKNPLKNYIDKHIKVDARVSKDLLLTIFTPNTPLHDGAVIISNGRLAAANCFFNPPPMIELTPTGGRHLAAIGITRDYDCVTLVVSEETGKISLAVNGELIKGLDREGLISRLQNYGI